MSVTRDGDVIRLSGPCRVEDAEPLVALLSASPDTPLDLSACEGLHAAVVQAILAFQPYIQGVSADPFVAGRLAPLLGRA